MILIRLQITWFSSSLMTYTEYAVSNIL